MKSVALVFPGQGSQVVGMAGDFMAEAATKSLFEAANDALGLDLAKLMREGPLEELTLTQNAQPALLVAGMAAFTYLMKGFGRELPELAGAVAGHSLGEYTAVCAAGGLSFEDAVRLVRLRGEAMGKANGGGMAAVLGLELEAVEKALQGSGVVVANDNSPGQVIVSGPMDKLAAAEEGLKKAGAKRLIRLNVSGAFHTTAMEEAAREVQVWLAEHSLKPLAVPCVMNHSAKLEQAPQMVATGLGAQVTGRVRWRETMGNLAEQGVTQVVELGVGKVLAGLAGRCDARLTGVSLDSPRAVDAWLETAVK